MYSNDDLIEYLSDSITLGDEDAYFIGFENVFIEMIEFLEGGKSLNLNHLAILEAYKEDMTLYFKERDYYEENSGNASRIH